MPATGNFRVRLGNLAGSILRVTARAGTTLTVDVEQDDGNASIGDTVRLVNTAAAMEALKADAIAGSGGGGGMPWWPTVVPVVGADFSWQNQGGATVTDANGISYLVAPPSPSTSLRVRSKATPATPWTVTALMSPNFDNATRQEGGLLLRESGTLKVLVVRLTINSGLLISTGPSLTSLTANPVVRTRSWMLAGPLWLRMGDDGTNLVFSISMDGRNFLELLSQLRTASFTVAPDQMGYFANDETNAIAAAISVFSWVQT